VHVVFDLPAVRPGRLAVRLLHAPLNEATRDLRRHLRGAAIRLVPDGIDLETSLDMVSIAELADVVRTLANEWPWLGFRLLADPPACRLEVRGAGPAVEVAQTIFEEVAR
jgi:hypothetical protein